jgi:hypothetical protein
VIRKFPKKKNFQISKGEPNKKKKKKKKKNFTNLLNFPPKKAPDNFRGYKQCWAVLDFYEETLVSAL